MDSQLNKLRVSVGALLALESQLTPELIRETIERVRLLYSDVEDGEAARLAREFETQHDVTMENGKFIFESGHESWLYDRKHEIEPRYWNRYRQLLIQEKRFSSNVINSLDDDTDQILDSLEDPLKGGSWDRRGLVVGHVQSGKTANYIGLICKAADAGFKFIVVIAGLHNRLRNQTQARIDEGFIGRDSSRLLNQSTKKDIGVGKYDKTKTPVALTRSLKDFNRQTATSVVGMSLGTFNVPVVCVVKKNAHSLKNLTEWLKETSTKEGKGLVNEPMLLIDDEADNASINIRYQKDEVSTINRQIRELLNLFECSGFVGYTATPFANIFIEPDTDDEMLQADLFPQHFIVCLEPPSNYFGAQKVFLGKSENVVKYITDNEEWLPSNHKIDWDLQRLPPSMIQAIRTFVVSCAIRLARRHGKVHCSMLVNASRFISVQHQMKNEISNVLGRIRQSVRIHAALNTEEATKDPEMAALRQTFEGVYGISSMSVDWTSLQGHLVKAVASIKVIEVNGHSRDSLNYSENRNGLSVIAVGGYSLSRGLTLEGLTVSYFLRNSMMYDTLMQMGRWFGYRNQYEDLCRIWMLEEAEGWYEHISESIEELREELREMAAVDATPRDFGLRVRSHPDALIVTARNKMGSGRQVRVRIGLSNRFCETAVLSRDEFSLSSNLAAVQRLGQRLENSGSQVSAAVKCRHGWLLTEVSPDPVLDFLGEFQNHQGFNLTDPAPIREYIEKRREAELKSWDILFASLKDGKGLTDQSLLGIKINCQSRTAGWKSDCRTLFVTNKQRVASRGVEQVGLCPDAIKAVQKRYCESIGTTLEDSSQPNYPDRIYRAVRKRPLLVIHLLDIQLGRPDDIEHSAPVVAWSISFPISELKGETVEYFVNDPYWKELYQMETDGDELNSDYDG